MPMLDQELQSLLKRNLELTEENNRLIRSIRRMTFWGGILKFVWWVLILIVLPAAAYYFYLAPYVKEFLTGVEEVRGLKANFESNNPLSDLQRLYEQYQSSRQ